MRLLEGLGVMSRSKEGIEGRAIGGCHAWIF